METIHHIKTGGTIGGCVPEYQEIEILSDIFSDIVDLSKYLNQSLKISSRLTEKEIWSQRTVERLLSKTELR